MCGRVQHIPVVNARLMAMQGTFTRELVLFLLQEADAELSKGKNPKGFGTFQNLNQIGIYLCHSLLQPR
jgi:hypothetical protein